MKDQKVTFRRDYRVADLHSEERRHSLIGSAFVVLLVIYLSLLIGSFAIAISDLDEKRWLPDENPIPLDLLLVAIPLLAGLFMFAFSDSKKVGLAGRSRDSLANIVLLITMALVVVAGASQVASLGDARLAKDLVEFFLVDGEGSTQEAQDGGHFFSGALHDAAKALGTFVGAPGLVIWQKFDFATVLYFVVLCMTAFVLAEAYRSLLDSRLGQSVREAQAKWEILRVEERIQRRIVGGIYTPLFSCFAARKNSPQSVQKSKRGWIYVLWEWVIDVGLWHRIVRVVVASVATILYFRLLRVKFGIENIHLLGITWLMLLTLASVEVSWLKVGTRSLGSWTAMGFGAALVLYVSIVGEEVERGLESSICLIILLIVFWGVGTFCGFSALGSRECRDEWLARNLYVWRQFEFSAVGQYGYPVKANSLRGGKRIANAILSPIRNRVASALYASQMKNDISYRFMKLNDEEENDRVSR